MTAPTFASQLTAAVRAVLDAHIATTFLTEFGVAKGTRVSCACGWGDVIHYIPDALALHRAHVAAVLAQGIEVAFTDAARGAT